MYADLISQGNENYTYIYGYIGFLHLKECFNQVFYMIQVFLNTECVSINDAKQNRVLKLIYTFYMLSRKVIASLV